MNNNQVYIGFTKDLEQRIKKHSGGKVFTAAKYLPVTLVYYEAYLSEKDARQREVMIKRYGSSYVNLKNRIENSLKEFQGRG